MNPPQLAIFGYSEAAMFLRGSPPANITAIISIHGVHEFGIEANVSHRLDLTFDDVEVPVAAAIDSLQRVMSRKRWAAVNGLVEIPPTSADAAAIIRFAELVRGDSGIVLCHCGGGMSRAPAAALICLAVWRGPGTEADCVAEVIRLRRGAGPHVGLVQFADAILHRNHRLIDALAAT